MSNYKFIWRDGYTLYGESDSPMDALMLLGFSGGGERDPNYHGGLERWEEITPEEAKQAEEEEVRRLQAEANPVDWGKMVNDLHGYSSFGDEEHIDDAVFDRLLEAGKLLRELREMILDVGSREIPNVAIVVERIDKLLKGD